MRFEIFGQEYEVTLPDDPVAFVKSHVVTILNYMGYEWPVTDTGVLDSWAATWDDMASKLNEHIANLESGVTQLASVNSGEGPDSVVAYMNSDESTLHSLKTVADAAPAAAFAYRGASMLITALRAYVIGQILLDVINIACAIITGGASAAVSLLAKRGATFAINLAIDQAINNLLGA